MKKRNGKPKKRADSTRRVLSGFFLLNVLLASGLALYCGVTYAGLGSREVSDGSVPPLLTWEDVSAFFEAAGR